MKTLILIVTLLAIVLLGTLEVWHIIEISGLNEIGIGFLVLLALATLLTVSEELWTIGWMACVAAVIGLAFTIIESGWVVQYYNILFLVSAVVLGICFAALDGIRYMQTPKTKPTHSSTDK